MAKEDVIVLSHYLRLGLSRRAPAKRLGMSRLTVRGYAATGEQEPECGPRPPRLPIVEPYKK